MNEAKLVQDIFNKWASVLRVSKELSISCIDGDIVTSSLTPEDFKFAYITTSGLGGLVAIECQTRRIHHSDIYEYISYMSITSHKFGTNHKPIEYTGVIMSNDELWDIIFSPNHWSELAKIE